MLAMGHRGAKDEAPENTVAGFRYAREIGVPAVEFDVQLSKDLQPVVIHDLTLDRTTNGSGRVKRHTRAQLSRLDARSVHTGHPAEDTAVPHLHEVLDVLEGGPELSVEIKTDTPRRLARLVPMVAQILRDRGLTELALMTSFDVNALTIAAEVASDLARGYIGNWDDPAWIDRAGALGATTACMRLDRSSDEMASRVRDAGLTINGWMVNDAEALEVARRRGVHHATTDRPTWLMGALAAS